MVAAVRWPGGWPVQGILAGLLVLGALGVQAETGSYHICTDEKGRKLFSQTPCPKGHESQVKEYEIKQPASGESGAAHQMSYEQLRDSNRKYELRRLIKKNRQDLKKLEAEREAKMGDMRTNLAGIAGRNSHNRAADILSVLEEKERGYMERISALKQTIHDQENELKSLEGL